MVRDVLAAEDDICKLEVIDAENETLAILGTRCGRIQYGKLYTENGEYDIKEEGIRKK